MNWVAELAAIVAAKGPIGLAAIRQIMHETHGESAAAWLDATFGVEGPRYVHSVDTTGKVTSTEVTR